MVRVEDLDRMKFIAVVVVVAVAVCDAAPVTFSAERWLKIVTVHPALATLRARRRESSDQCISESETLVVNEGLISAAAGLGKACQQYVTMEDDPFSITIDWTDCPAVADFEPVCTAVGGQNVITPSIRIGCVGTGFGVMPEGESFDLLMSGLPDCIGAACEANDFRSAGLSDQIEVELERQLGAQCLAHGTSGAPRTASRIILFIGGVAALLSLLYI